jgi:hypothetical protein
MIRNRSTRVFATLGVTVSLALAATAGPALVSAAPAPLLIGLGDTVGTPAASGAEPGTVAPGNYVAFNTWATNNGSSNISKLFLTGTATPGDFAGFDLTNSPGLAGDCAQGPAGASDIRCSWLGVAPGATIQLKFIVSIPSSASSPVALDWEWSTSGYVDNAKGKNNSHGDAFKKMDSAALNSNNLKFDGSYIVNDLQVGTNDLLNRNNPQFVKVNSPVTGIGVTTEEQAPTAADLAACQAAGGSCVLDGNVLHLDNGNTLPQFTAELGYNVNKPGMQFIHITDGGISEDVPACVGAPVAPCAVVTTANGKTFATIYLTENGKIYGY